MTSTDTCAHDACLCTKPYSPQVQASATRPLDPHAEYCSPRCEQLAAGAPSDDGCECGHPPCQAMADDAIPPMQ